LESAAWRLSGVLDISVSSTVVTVPLQWIATSTDLGVSMTRYLTSRVVISVVAAVICLGLTVPNPAAAVGQANPNLLEGSPKGPGSGDVVVAPKIPKVASAAAIESTPAQPVKADFPDPGAADLTLGRPGERARAGDLPIELAAGSAAAQGKPVRVEVLDRAAAERAGASGFVFQLAGLGGRGMVADRIELSVDYSGFVNAYGASFAERLRLVALPPCAVAKTPVLDCDRIGRPVTARNDRHGQRLTALLDSDGAALLAVTAGTTSEEGSFRASPLEASSDWQVGIGSGQFTWTYPIPVPTPPSGAPPSLGLGYSSSAIDGLTSTRNTQAGPLGLGFGGFGNAFVERRYITCSDDGALRNLLDLCWQSDNAVLSLNGHAAELIPMDKTAGPTAAKEWRMASDPYWRIEQIFGAASDPTNGDDDREWWKVTARDGTEYWFGRGYNPDNVTQVTNSVFTVPMYGNGTTEPCQGAVCMQGWRWNLDRVVDPNGNVATYSYAQEINKYTLLGGFGATERAYVRAGQVASIEYGAHSGPTVAAQAKVEFGIVWRCSSLSPKPETDPEGCKEPKTGADGTAYPDVPVDLICVNNTAACTIHSPSFFTARRYSQVRTYVFVDNAWKPVDEFNLTHSFDPKPDPAVKDKLVLTGVQRRGVSASPSITLPATTFDYVKLDNRVATSTNPSVQPHYRVSTVVDEFGRKVSVSYGHQSGHACTSDQAPAGGWQNNTKECFRQQWVPDGDPAPPPQYGVFHKWVVTQVKVEDTTTGSRAMTTGYAYEGDPAWHYDTDRFVTTTNQGWEDWRGYGTVLVTQGASRTRYRVFRGMHGDRLSATTTRTVELTSLDDAALKHKDWNWLAGSTFDEAQLSSGSSPVTLVGTVHTYMIATTVDDDTVTGNDPHAEKAAVWTGEQTTTERRRKPDGAYAKRRTTVGYNGFLLFPESVEESGWLDTTGDERCTKTTYVFNPAEWMLDYPSSVRMLTGTCASPGAELRVSETAYDNAGYGTAPTKGNRTKERIKLTPAPTWAETSTTYDGLGRKTLVIDPLGRQTTTAYSPPTGNPKTVTTTALAHLADALKRHVTVTDFHVERAAPSRQVNPNGKVTTFGYDALGRSIWAKQPTEQAAGDPNSTEFVYTIDPNRANPPVVRTRQLQSTGPSVYVESWEVYDSLLRIRQTHRLSPTTGRVIVANTTYDDRGNPVDESSPQAVPGTAGSGILSPAQPWENHTQRAYDELSRVVWELFWANTPDPAPPATPTGDEYQWSALTTYTHNSSTVQRDIGGDITSVTDAYDRLAEVQEQSTRGSEANKAITKYGYNLAGDLTSVTDPANRVITYGYDLTGQRIKMVDPDSGTWDYAYDAVGNQTMVKDSRPAGNATYTKYDDLNRSIERRQDNATTGRVLATWAYDAAGQKGLLDNSVSYHKRPNGEGDEAFITDITAYDDRSRPTNKTFTVFADRAGIFGSYSFAYGYDEADHLVSTIYPPIGDANGEVLPAEWLVTEYNNLGLPAKQTGYHGSPTVAETYLNAAGYDDRARPRWFGYGEPTGGVWKFWEYDLTQRLTHTEAWAAVQTPGHSVLQSRTLTYDDLQNVTRRTTALGNETWVDCYGFDDRNRLTRAYSTPQANPCATAEAGTGDAPYDDAYSYSPDGNITQRVENVTSANPRTHVYSYDASQPHATDKIDSTPESGLDTTYTWDAAGQMMKRERSGGDYDTLVWTPDRRLDRVQDPNGNSRDSFAYDADGNRVLRENVNRTTIYIDGHEISANGGGGVTVVRTYRVDDQPIATRTRPAGTSTPTLSYLVTDNQGSVELSIKAGESTPEGTRTYLPYGTHAGAEFLTDRGWIGEVEDDATNLNYLGARYFDPFLARFIAPDPLFNLNEPKSVNPYRYGMNNPTTYTDPSGMQEQPSGPTDDDDALRSDGKTVEEALLDIYQFRLEVGLRILYDYGNDFDRVAQIVGVTPDDLKGYVLGQAVEAIDRLTPDDGPVVRPEEESDCSRDWISLACTGQVMSGNFEISVSGCLGYCLGIGWQSGYLYAQRGQGCCMLGVNAGFAKNEYADRECSSGVVSIPGTFSYIESGADPNFEEFSYGLNPSDPAGGLSLGLGGGTAILENHDLVYSGDAACQWVGPGGGVGDE
jgi:RHS repeat-associated protein